MDSAALLNLSNWLLSASAKSLPVLACILLAQQALKKQFSAKARHWLWLSFYLCLSLPLGWKLNMEPLQIIFSADTQPPSTNNQLATIQPNAVAAFSSNPVNTIPPTILASQATPITIKASRQLELFSYIWLGVFCSLSLITLLQAIRFYRIKINSQTVNENTQQIFDQVKSKLDFQQPIALLASTQIASPLTLGLFKPAILLPNQLQHTLTPAQLEHVLLHELTHIHRRDLVWNWLSYWITLFHWFNPFAWYACKRMKADMEMACDAQTLHYLNLQQREDYALTLVELSQSTANTYRFTPSLGILENHRELKNRLIMIKEFTRMNLKTTLTFGAILSALTFSSLAQPTSDKTETTHSAQTEVENSISLLSFAQRAEHDLKTHVLVGRNISAESIPNNIGEKPLDYGQFLSHLKVNGFTAYRSQGYIQIIPIRDARNSAIPIVEPGKKYFDDEFVTEFLQLKKGCSMNYLQTLRPMVPMDGLLAPNENQKMLVIADTYANVQRIKAVIQRMEDGLTKVDSCKENQDKDNK